MTNKKGRAAEAYIRNGVIVIMPLDLSGDITGEPQCAKDWK